MIVSSATSGAPVPIATPGAPTVLIGGLPAACVGSSCGVDAVVMGSTAVLLGGVPAARVGDPTGAGGSIVGPGAPTVMIGG
jgi:uncharacterized Zn-binding protein involved in type VI secretion